jgi:O-antigen/teichoic acid export membrane protein
MIKNKSVFIFLALNALNPLTSILLIPFITDRLEPAEYGMIAIWQVSYLLLSNIISIGIDGKLQSKAFDLSTWNDVYLVEAAIGFTLVGVFVYLIGFLIIALPILKGIGFPVNNWVWLVLAGIAQATTSTVLSVWMVQRKLIQYATTIIVGTFSSSIITVAMILNGSKADGRIIGIVGGLLGSILVILFYLSRCRLDIRDITLRGVASMLSGGQYYMVHSLAGFALGSVDRFLLAICTTTEETGKYFLGLQLASGFSLIQDAIGKSWFSEVALKYGQNEKCITRNALAVKAAKMFILLMAMSLTYSAALSVFLPKIMNSRYIDTFNVIYVLSFGYAVNGVYKILVPFVLISNQSMTVARNTVVSLVVNITLGLFLVPIYGAQGVCWSFVGSMVSMVILFWISANSEILKRLHSSKSSICDAQK